ncbi:MAG: outer membrane beta-barrel protein [Limisphaerales bacterium]|jgi:hypothetical protein|nr:outer membrane beta-barrel protein [Verrucomicrobiota bacterium]
MKKTNYLFTLALLTAGPLCALKTSAEESENQLLTAISGTTLSGYVDTSMGWQFGDKKTSAGRVNDAADRQNGFNLNVVQLRISKELDEDASLWSAGYAASLLMGPTASELAYVSGNNDFALQHAYVDLRAPLGNGLNFRFGAFESLTDFEGLETYENPNYSRSYGSYLAHGQSVGGLVSYEFDLNGWLLELTAGIANAYDNPTINERASHSARLSYMGAVSLIFPESTGFLEGTELFVSVVNGVSPDGDEDIAPNSRPSTVGYNAWLLMPLPLEGFSWAFSHNHVCNTSRGYTDPEDASRWSNAYGVYLIYEATDRLTFANRIEYADGSPGTYNQEGIHVDWGTKQDQFLANTFTASYRLWENVLTRAEFRWDRDLSSNRRMSDDGSRNNAFGVAANILYRF